jgi:hypothetical protein
VAQTPPVLVAADDHLDLGFFPAAEKMSYLKFITVVLA